MIHLEKKKRKIILAKNLPNELWLMILEFLPIDTPKDIQDLLEKRLVCKNFKANIDDRFLFFRSNCDNATIEIDQLKFRLVKPFWNAQKHALMQLGLTSLWALPLILAGAFSINYVAESNFETTLIPLLSFDKTALNDIVEAESGLYFYSLFQPYFLYKWSASSYSMIKALYRSESSSEIIPLEKIFDKAYSINPKTRKSISLFNLLIKICIAKNKITRQQFYQQISLFKDFDYHKKYLSLEIPAEFKSAFLEIYNSFRSLISIIPDHYWEKLITLIEENRMLAENTLQHYYIMIKEFINTGKLDKFDLIKNEITTIADETILNDIYSYLNETFDQYSQEKSNLACENEKGKESLLKFFVELSAIFSPSSSISESDHCAQHYLKRDSILEGKLNRTKVIIDLIEKQKLSYSQQANYNRSIN